MEVWKLISLLLAIWIFHSPVAAQNLEEDDEYDDYDFDIMQGFKIDPEASEEKTLQDLAIHIESKIDKKMEELKQNYDMSSEEFEEEYDEELIEDLAEILYLSIKNNAHDDSWKEVDRIDNQTYTATLEAWLRWRLVEFPGLYAFVQTESKKYSKMKILHGYIDPTLTIYLNGIPINSTVLEDMSKKEVMGYLASYGITPDITDPETVDEIMHEL